MTSPTDRARAALEALEALELARYIVHVHQWEGGQFPPQEPAELLAYALLARAEAMAGDIVRETPSNSRGVAPARTGHMDARASAEGKGGE